MGIGSAAGSLLDDKTRMTQLVTGLSFLALGVYAAKNGTRVVSNLVEKQLGRPPLVRETSRWTWNKAFGSFGGKAKNPANILEKIVLEEELAQRLDWTTNSLVNAKKNGTPFRHMLLHGP